MDAAEKPLERSSSIDDKFLRAVAEGNYAHVKILLFGWDTCIAVTYENALTVLLATEDPMLKTRALGIRAAVELVRSNYEESVVAAKHCQAAARANGDVFLFSAYSIVEAWAMMLSGSWGKLRYGFESTLDIMVKNANRRISNTGKFMVAWLHLEVFDYKGARNICKDVIDAVEDGNFFSFFLGRTLLAKACMGLNDLSEAGYRLNEIIRRIEIDGVLLESYCYPLFYEARAEYWLAMGKPRDAEAHALTLGAFARRAPDRTYLALAHVLFCKIADCEAQLDRASGELDQAISAVEQAQPPLAAWKVYVLAAEFYDRMDEGLRATAFWDRSDRAIATLAENFDEMDPLRNSLLEGYAAKTGRHL